MKTLVIMLVYFASAMLGSMAGGAALITIPTLIFAGISPHTAIGTNKVGSVGIGAGAAHGYREHHELGKKIIFSSMLLAAAGSIIGSLVILSINEIIVKKIIGVIMIIVVALLFIDKGSGIKTLTKRINRKFLVAFSFASGVYSGFYGAGMGIINRFVLSKFFYMTMISSSALSVVFSLASGIVSFLVFAYFGKIEYSLIVPVLLSSLLGSYAGARYSIKLGNEKLKIVLAVVSAAMAVQLLFF